MPLGSHEIKIPCDNSWNTNRLTVVEKPSAMGDRLLVCIHDVDECNPDMGVTVMVYRSDFLRLASMIAIPFGADQ